MDEQSMEYSESDLNLELETLRKRVIKAQKPLTIAIIGQHGCGKSSFLNTVMAVLRGEYHENALVGNFEDEGEHVTRRLTRYPKTRYLDESSVEDFTQKWPTFVDMMGFQNAGDEGVRKILDSIINGCFKDGTKLNTSLRNKRDVGDFLQQFYYGEEISRKVDRIIFVASAISRELPCELIRALVSQAMDGGRDVPIFGVLTHADKVQERDPDFVGKFKRSLGLNDQRFLLCSNYCDNIPPQENRVPRVEVPIARFLQQVLNPSRHVFQEKPDYVEYVRRRINVPLKVVLEYTLFLLFSFIFTTKHILWFLFILVLITLLTKFFLRLFLHYRPEDLNLRVGTMLKRCLDHE
uniref:Uncharacterized protein LOC111131601 isoform X2 n=1 Tax=Crassostrea virginica TaxID=6565 RepID=A0A8B8E3Y2_CRAVI|nr:uncharacterized protein LOC111131601 isoform X2 [Crassostrea virginica]